jgi:hypothetical protein
MRKDEKENELLHIYFSQIERDYLKYYANKNVLKPIRNKTLQILGKNQYVFEKRSALMSHLMDEISSE